MTALVSFVQLSTLEEDFIYAAEFGDIPTVQRILDENPSLNVDFNDILGRTPLRLAVGNEHLEVWLYFALLSSSFFQDTTAALIYIFDPFRYTLLKG